MVVEVIEEVTIHVVSFVLAGVDVIDATFDIFETRFS